MKTLEQYFSEQPLLPDDQVAPFEKSELSEAEQAFLTKYLGVTDTDKKSVARHINAPDPVQVMAGPAELPEVSPEPPVKHAPEHKTPGHVGPQLPGPAHAQKTLRDQEELQLIGFRLAEQEYALPIDVIQEVIRAVAATRLPSTPAFLAGVVNLRGKVTPLVSLRVLLGIPAGEDKFVVVCRHAGLQLGLQIQAVSTMHRVAQNRIDWGIESLLGVQNDFITGLIRSENHRLIGILSLDHIVHTLLKT
ncbi:MAG TPA: purine-binding chemotaxis protein CheW [Desulfonatronum sp.]|nr:purine-binding chemotaxis protein CheW [Desulfonatronum sp.]